MAGVSFKINVTGLKKLDKKLRQIDPERHRSILTRSLTKAALLVQKIAATEKIDRGRGPKAPVLLNKLTSRRGGAGLVGSIRVNRSGFPHFVEIGTDLGYGAEHELGLKGRKKRPFLAPALKDAEKRIRRIFEQEMNREIRK